MRAVIQRVSSAQVDIESKTHSRIERGLLVLLAVSQEDTIQDAFKIAKKISEMRIFSNQDGKFDYSVKDLKGEILLVSQFTLYGDASKGRRPDFTKAAGHKKAKELYEKTKEALQEQGLSVKTGVFAAQMLVRLENEGPVTIIYDTKQE